MAIKPTVETVGDAALTDSIIDRSITELQDNVITTLQPYALASCSSLKKCVFGELTEVLNNCFSGDDALDTLDIYSTVEFDASALQGLSGLKTLILRSNTMCDASSSAVLSYTPIEEGTGYIYVPADLVDSYKHDFVWGSYESQIRAIEDYPDVCSTAGKVWENTTTNVFEDIAYGDGLWVAASSSGMWYSYDCKVWTKGTIDSWKSPKQVIKYRGVWVTFCYDGAISTSADGVAWKSCYSGKGGTACRLEVVNGVLFAWASASSSKTSYYSFDGTTWAQTPFTDTLHNITYCNGKWYASCNNGLYSSSDCIEWSASTYFTSARYFAYANGVYVAIGSTGGSAVSYYSSDGETWTKSSGASSLSATIRGEYYKGLFVLVVSSSIYTSANGATWTKVTITGGGEPRNIVATDDICLAFGANNVRYSLDGVTWEVCAGVTSIKEGGGAASASGKQFAVCTSSGLYYSE